MPEIDEGHLILAAALLPLLTETMVCVLLWPRQADGTDHIAFSPFDSPKSNAIKLVLRYSLNMFAKGMSNYTALRDIMYRKSMHRNRVIL